MYLLLTSASRKLLALIKTASRPSLARYELTSQVFPEIVYILTHINIDFFKPPLSWSILRFKK